MKKNIKNKLNFLYNIFEFNSFRIIILIILLILLTSNNLIFPIIKKGLYINNIYNKKSILFISPTFGGGGAERVTCLLASELSKRHKVYLIYFTHLKKEYNISSKVHLIQLPKHNNFSESNIFRFIENTLEKYKIDIMINFLRWFNKFDVNIRKGTKFIFSERCDPNHRNISKLKSMMSVYKKADIIVFQTNYVRNQFKGNIHEKGVVITNPIQVEYLSVNYSTSKKIVTVGRLVPQKNQALLIEAFSLFKKRHKGYILYIYGSGILLKKLKELVKSKNLENCIYFKGYSLHIHEEIKDAEFFVLSSDFEGLPNSLMEAMKMGIPSISTNCPGISEIITDYANGLLVPLKNVTALANAMSRLSDNITLRNIIRKEALTKSKEWELSIVAKKWEKLFY